MNIDAAQCGLRTCTKTSLRSHLPRTYLPRICQTMAQRCDKYGTCAAPVPRHVPGVPAGMPVPFRLIVISPRGPPSLPDTCECTPVAHPGSCGYPPSHGTGAPTRAHGTLPQPRCLQGQGTSWDSSGSSGTHSSRSLARARGPGAPSSQSDFDPL